MAQAASPQEASPAALSVMSRRAWKLQDYVAHAGDARCARLGEKSGQVLASGGEDRRVNIWKVGKPNAMMSLTGHNSTVECLVFDKQEEVLVVGCAGGSMQVWNLEYRKMAGTLTGHRTACASVEFHPYGEFFASGSADTNLKIWDLRRKSCIQTYKGHTGSVTSIRFSPHGRWVATGGQDSKVKMWDLTAGKLMRDLDIHKGPITSLAFHPKEYLLATGSADRTMKLWSLESFRAIGTTELGTSPVQAVKFYVEEQAVLAASQDSLRAFPVDELAVPLDTIDVDWRGLQDMRLCFPEEKLLAITADGPQLGLWVADLQRREIATARGPGGGGGYGRLHSRAGPVAHTKLLQPAGGAAERAVGEPADGSSAVSGSGRSTAAGAESRGALTPAAGGGLPEPLAEPPADLGAGAAESGPAGGGTPKRAAAAAAALAAACSAGPPAVPPRPLDEQISILAAQHPQMVGVLQRRLDQVRRLKELWVSGNLVGLGSILSSPQDHAAFCDFARAIMQQRLGASLNLDACQTLLPIVQDLLGSKYDDFVNTAVQFTEVLLQHFGDLIAETRLSCSKIPERQLDLAREERLRKCNACYEHFQELHRLLPNRHAGSRCGSVRSALLAFLQRS
uniref:Katanin p80 WD40 repeat-containing subunit B1 homolog n=1 Tax=Pyrodinium bahamense TaxID=73915 RepID=A0A7S0B7X0_9DINO